MNQPLLDAKQIDKDPDIVQLVLNACLEHGFPEEMAQKIRVEIYKKYGGRSVYVPRFDRQQRKEALSLIQQRGLSKDVLMKLNISQATAYRLLRNTVKKCS